MKFLKNKKNNKEGGFVILVAVLVSSLLISIGIFISTVAYKEMKLAIASVNSQKSFYAANSALECATYHDYFNGPFPENSADILDMGGRISDQVRCNGQDWQIYYDGYTGSIPAGMNISATSTSAVSYFEISFQRNYDDCGIIGNPACETEDGQPYARVRIEKTGFDNNNPNPNNEVITIQAFGHNKKTGAGIVERAMRIRY